MPSHPASWVAQTAKLDRAARRKKVGPKPEAVVQKAIQEAFRLKYRVALVHADPGAGRVNGGGRYSSLPEGWPDLMGVVPPTGRALFIEVKAPGNKPTVLQLRHLEALRAKGAIALWADSVESALFQFEEAMCAS